MYYAERIPSIEELQHIAPRTIFQDSYGDGIAVYNGQRCSCIAALRRAIIEDINQLKTEGK